MRADDLYNSSAGSGGSECGGEKEPLLPPVPSHASPSQAYQAKTDSAKKNPQNTDIEGIALHIFRLNITDTNREISDINTTEGLV